jgi:hypothetical protein
VSTLPPRAVVVVRPTELEALLARHGTRGQARFFLSARGERIEDVEERHACVRGAVESVLAQIPLSWRRAVVLRDDLDRFLFAPEDVVIAVGQDGLVANCAKYLAGQPVVGVDPGLYDGVLVPHRPQAAGALMVAAAAGEAALTTRTLVEARTDDGQRLLALNEIFIGHRSHQSARYVLEHAGRSERHSSSGVVVSTGTGATGWARSICRQRADAPRLPALGDRRLVFLVREAFPSRMSGTELCEGTLEDGESLRLKSEMNEGGTVFGDGIEGDRIDLFFGQSVQLRAARTALSLVEA